MLPGVLTFIVKSIQNQRKLFEEVYIIVWAVQGETDDCGALGHCRMEGGRAHLRTESWCAVMVADGLNRSALSFATSTFGRPT